MMSQQTGTNSTRRLPFADAGSFSGWLIQGLLRFNNAMLSTGWGEDNAFPGYTFSVENGIPQQFPEFFFDLCDDDAKRAVRDGLVLTLKRLRTRPEWLSLLLFDVIRIGLNVAPDLVASNAVAFLPLIREIAARASDRHPYAPLYTSIVTETLNVIKGERPLYSIIQQECFSSQHPIPEAVPLLCVAMTEYEPENWPLYGAYAGELIWPRDLSYPDQDTLERFAMVIQAICRKSGPALVAKRLFSTISFLKEPVDRGKAFLHYSCISDDGF